MWKIFGTVVFGGTILLVYKTVSYVLDNSYFFKLPGYTTWYRPRYYIARNFKDCVEAVLNLLSRRTRVISVVGMDCEMTSTSVNGGHPVPAVLQLANPNGFCAIFQLKVIGKAKDEIKVPYLTEKLKIFNYKLPSENIIRQILEDKSVLKVGVGVIEDANYLDESYGMFSKGCLDIRHMAKHVGIQPRGLNYLAKNVLGKEKLEIKHKQPWESEHLNQNQIEYAVQDARLGVEIFLKLNQIMVEKSYSWPRRLFWDEKTYWKYSFKLFRGYIGKRFEFSSKQNYDDCFTTWLDYIPKEFMLHGKKLRYMSFILESGVCTRMCCVCGYPDEATLNVKLKAVVPVDYNVEFPGEYNLYYICLCNECLEECRTKVDYELRLELTKECGAPYPDYQDHRLNTAKKLAAELLASDPRDKGGQEWVHILESYLHKMLPELPEDKFYLRTMEIILSMDCWPESEHGRFIHDYFSLYGGGLEELRWRWFERFWKVMRPQYLPPAFKHFYCSHNDWFKIMS